MILEAKNIEKMFYEPTPFKVLKEVSLEVKEGEFLSIVGKSGCGKSTLLYILSTMDTNYTGDLYIKGESLKGNKQNQLAAFRNRHLGFVFQFHFLLPEFTALKNVMLPALKLGKFTQEEVRERALQKLEMVDMVAHAEKPAAKLSGGQQQRVAIARALINDPAIIMGDEPTGNLDQANSQLVFSIFKDLAKYSKQSIITVTHDTDFAAKTDRVVEMQDGTIINHGYE